MPRCHTCNRRSPRETQENPPLRQLLLSSSQDRQLCIAPPSTSRHSVHSNEQGQPLFNNTSLITKIPDELLNEIFTHALPSRLSRDDSYHTALALSIVCKSFHRIVQPLMYSTLDFGRHSLARPCLAVKQLHRSIKANLVLGAMVTCLRVHVEYLMPVDSVSEADFTIAKELVAWMENVEEFEIQGGYEHPSTWPMARHGVQKWKRLRNVSLMREDWTLMREPVCELVMATLNLTTLDLYGVSASRAQNNIPQTLWTSLSKDKERTSAITHLSIHDFGESPEALSHLLKLPRVLTHFSFGKIYYCPVPWRLEMFQALLEPHQDTLQRVEIGALSVGFTPINFLSFPNLEVLQLSHLVYRAPPDVAATSLLAPRLRTFIWDFRVLDQHSEAWEDFGDEQKEWLVRFCQLAKEKQSALKKVEILFSPDEWHGPRSKELLEGVVSPWEIMDQISDVVKGFEIELVYERRTREELLMRIEKEQQLLESEEDKMALRGEYDEDGVDGWEN